MPPAAGPQPEDREQNRQADHLGGDRRTSGPSLDDLAFLVAASGLHLDKSSEVYEILEKLKQVDFLSFEWQDKPLENSQLAKVQAAPDRESKAYAAPFEIIIPLKTPFSLKK